MKIILSILISLMLFTFSGCTKDVISNKVTGDEKKAEEYVKSKGYKIIAYNGEIQNYKLEKSKLYGAPDMLQYQQIWAIQKVEPDEYFEKEISVYGFIVKKHPLQERDKTAKNVMLYSAVRA